ncbi:hypothetical protein CRG98_007717 [Punica granatum]|uniref:Uncharacterized protein n=1 Tax=Punica granatum TaxID=22663 RepID=A0A2I0KTS4_PUNGR|nr:hypothetical protein CRG98_007717 [Punica granatum]
MKKRKQKEKGKEKVQEVSKHKRPSYKSKDMFKMTIQTDVVVDHDDTIPASPASPPANLADDVEETPAMDDRLSDGYKSEELESLVEDSDEKNDKFPMYNAEDSLTEEITIGMDFENLDVFKMAVRNTNIAVGREVNFMKNDKTNTYQVMTYDLEHTCGRRIENKLATREWVANKFIPRLRTQPNMSAQQVFEFFIHTYQVKLHDAMVFKATKLAKQKCEGEEREQYAMLRDYVHEILRSNPGSTILLQVQLETHEFERLYICLEACKRGFQEGCRPIIGLDGCFLKGYYDGQLLSAVPQMLTFAEASFFQPMTAPPMRPHPVRPPQVRPHHTPITAHTMEAASSGTAARFATYFQPRGPPPN